MLNIETNVMCRCQVNIRENAVEVPPETRESEDGQKRPDEAS